MQEIIEKKGATIYKILKYLIQYLNLKNCLNLTMLQSKIPNIQNYATYTQIQHGFVAKNNITHLGLS